MQTKEQKNDYNRKYYQENKITRQESSRKSYVKNIEHRKKWAVKYYKENIVKVKEYQKEYRSKHSDETKIYLKRWHEKNPQKKISYHLKRKFNISVDDYNILLSKQAGICAICLKPEIVVDPRTGEIRRLAVDHDHVTGEIRGLLCTNCNLMIGCSFDNPEMLRRAIDYLLKI